MQRLRAALIAVLVAAVFAVALFLGLLAWRFTAARGPQLWNTATVVQQVQTLAQLVTVKYVMEKIVVIEDAKWYGDNRLLLVAHGTVKAGVDLKQLATDDVAISGKKISIRLPRTQITDAYLDEKQTRVLERTTGVMREFDKDLEQSARQNAVDDLRRAARTSGILRDAEERAQSQLTALFRQAGFEEVEFLPRE